jgi:hypothetical protein
MPGGCSQISQADIWDLACYWLCTLRARAAQAAKWSSSTRLSSGSLHTQLNTEALQRPATLQIVCWQAGSKKLPSQFPQHHTQSI